jgi:hypothetical protein
LPWTFWQRLMLPFCYMFISMLQLDVRLSVMYKFLSKWLFTWRDLLKQWNCLVVIVLPPAWVWISAMATDRVVHWYVVC